MAEQVAVRGWAERGESNARPGQGGRESRVRIASASEASKFGRHQHETGAMATELYARQAGWQPLREEFPPNYQSPIIPKLPEQVI